MKDTATPLPERVRYQAALERHTTIAWKAGIAFAGLHFLTDERDLLKGRVGELQHRLQFLRNSGALRVKGAAHSQANLESEEINREIESIDLLIALGEKMRLPLEEQARTLGRQRDDTAKVVERLKRELTLLERSDHHEEMQSERTAHRIVGGTR